MEYNSLALAIEQQRKFFASGATLPWSARRDCLLDLRQSILRHVDDIAEALKTDLHKSPFESYSTETGMVLTEIRTLLRVGRRMSRPKRIRRSAATFNGRSVLQRQPYGQTLIFAPFNYPFHLAVLPLVGAIAAGNVVTLKFSPLTPATNDVTRRILKALPKGWVVTCDGDAEQGGWLLERRWNHIFVTGSPRLGHIAMAAAAKYLTPVTLELGGKSPCVVDADANLEVAARRIVFGKLTNAGQTCIAPDYLLVHNEVKTALVEAIARQIASMYGNDPRQGQMPCMVTSQAVQRLANAVAEGHVLLGGNYDAATRYMEPTLVEDLPEDNLLMTDEIFGPVLPVVTFDRLEKAIEYINAGEKPLALYYFTSDRRKAKQMLTHTSSGGACINDTLMHIVNGRMPFGGVENSGMGHYHGRYSFDCFSHQRAVQISSQRLDLRFKYPPYSDGALRLLRRFLR